MFRKTAYLLGIWGDGEWTALKQSGRHKTETSAEIYKRDADTLKLIDDVFKNPKNRVSTWRPIFCETPKEATYLNLESTAYALPLHEVACQFIHRELGVNAGHPFLTDSLAHAAMKYKKIETADEEILKFAREENINEEKAKKLRHLVLAAALELSQKHPGSPTNELETLHTTGKVGASPSNNQGSPEEAQKRKRGGDNDLDGRKEIAKIPRLEDKLSQLLELDTKITGELTEGARTFVVRTLNPVLSCLKNHFSGNQQAFCDRWRAGFKAKFSNGCCNGKGNSCGL